VHTFPAFPSEMQARFRSTPWARPLSSPQIAFLFSLTLWSQSLSKCYLRIQSVPQREHHTSLLQRSTG
jgi:hypothetical protein